VAVFALYCPRHGHQVLLDLDQIVRLVNAGDGLIVMEARCYDGENLVGITGSHSHLTSEEVGHRPTAPPMAARQQACGADHSRIGQQS
jgi:hypothetical protein